MSISGIGNQRILVLFCRRKAFRNQFPERLLFFKAQQLNKHTADSRLYRILSRTVLNAWITSVGTTANITMVSSCLTDRSATENRV